MNCRAPASISCRRAEAQRDIARVVGDLARNAARAVRGDVCSVASASPMPCITGGAAFVSYGVKWDGGAPGWTRCWPCRPCASGCPAPTPRRPPRHECRAAQRTGGPWFAGAALISTTSLFVRFCPRAADGVGVLSHRHRRNPARRPRSRCGAGARRCCAAGLMLLPAFAFAVDLWLWHLQHPPHRPGTGHLLGNFQVFLMALAGWLAVPRAPRSALYRRTGPGLAGLWLLVGARLGRLRCRLPRRRGARYRHRGCLRRLHADFPRGAQRGRLDLSAAQWLCLNSLLCAAMLGPMGLGEGVSFAVPDAQSWLSSLLGLGLVGQVLGWR